MQHDPTLGHPSVRRADRRHRGAMASRQKPYARPIIDVAHGNEPWLRECSGQGSRDAIGRGLPYRRGVGRIRRGCALGLAGIGIIFGPLPPCYPSQKGWPWASSRPSPLSAGRPTAQSRELGDGARSVLPGQR
jgi:hypothetical protein